MKVLVVGGGASWSLKDVENGVVDGIRSAGAEVWRYALDRRLIAAEDYLTWMYRRAKRHKIEIPEPTKTDMKVHALRDMVTQAIVNHVDWVLVISGVFMPLMYLDILRAAGLPVAILLTESPYDQEHELLWSAHTDLAWTNERSSVAAFRSVQPRTSYLPHAWREGVHDAVSVEDVAAHDVVFVGSCFAERVELLEAIDWTGIDFGLYGPWHRRLSRRSKLRAHLRAAIVDNETAAALYRRAKIGLNLYRESKGWSKNAPRIMHAESLNPRAYELAACGCFHLSSDRAEVAEIFGALVPTFSTAAEAEDLIRGWLTRDADRRDVARQLPHAVAGRSWNERGAQIVRELTETLPAALARVAQDVQARLERVA